jgi:hypothetical protein
MEHHAVQIYEDGAELVGKVTAYLAEGFEAGEPAVVVATRDHVAGFTERLAAAGWDAPRLGELLVVADAETTLAAIMRGDEPSAAAFEQVVGKLLDRVAKRFPGQRIRAFGELVNLLCERDQVGAAVVLEELWERLGRSRGFDFSLLCGYRLDVFDRAAQVGPLPHVCRLHSHVVPAADTARLARAVDRALQDVLGPQHAGKVYVLVGKQIREERVPAAQLVLMWVSANLPALAERILASARAHYAAVPLASAAG